MIEINSLSYHALLASFTFLLAKISGMGALLSLMLTNRIPCIILGSLWGLLIILTIYICIDWFKNNKNLQKEMIIKNG